MADEKVHKVYIVNNDRDILDKMLTDIANRSFYSTIVTLAISIIFTYIFLIYYL